MKTPPRVTVADVIRYHEALDTAARLREIEFQHLWEQTEQALNRLFGQPQSISQTMENSPGGIQSMGDIVINK